MDKQLRRQITAIPNLYGYFRILLIPEFIWLYAGGDRYAALAVLILSALSDMLDGRAARALGQVTPLGRVLDPVADKLTQLAVVSCLVFEHGPVIYLFYILMAKEVGAIICGAALISGGGRPFNSMWYGKLTTMVLYAYFGILLTFILPESAVLYFTAAVCFIALVTFVLYTLEFIHKIIAIK